MYCDGKKVGEGLEDGLVVCKEGWRGRHFAGGSLHCPLMDKSLFSQAHRINAYRIRYRMLLLHLWSHSERRGCLFDWDRVHVHFTRLKISSRVL